MNLLGSCNSSHQLHPIDVTEPISAVQSTGRGLYLMACISSPWYSLVSL